MTQIATRQDAPTTTARGYAGAESDTAAETVLAAVHKLVPILRANAPAGEQRRWVGEETLAALEAAGVFRIAVPKRFGGLDLTVAEQVDVLAAIGSGDGSTVWVAAVYVAEAAAVQGFDEALQAEIFAGGSVRISGTFTPSATLTPVEGGYRLNGAWKWNTGCRGASWDLVTALLDGPDGTPIPYYVVVPMQDLSIADDWFASSASATGSSKTTAADVFIPAHRAIVLDDFLHATTPAAATNEANKRNYPLLPFVSAQSVGPFLGMARGALELFLDRIPGRQITYTYWTDQAQYPVSQVQLGTAASMVAAAEGLSRQSVELLQRHADAGSSLSLEESVEVHANSAYAVELCRQSVDLLYRDSGASSIMSDVPIQRFYRDIQGLSKHAALALNPKMELYGRVLLGLEPGTAFI